MTKRRNPGADVREDVRKAIGRAWPGGVVEMAFDSDESYLWDVYPKLAAAFQRIKDAQLVHERESEGGPVWFDHSDPEEDPPDDQERSRSYHLFFVCPTGETFTYETEMENLAEPGGMEDAGENEFTEMGQRIDPEAEFRKFKGEQAFENTPEVARPDSRHTEQIWDRRTAGGGVAEAGSIAASR